MYKEKIMVQNTITYYRFLVSVTRCKTQFSIVTECYGKRIRVVYS